MLEAERMVLVLVVPSILAIKLQEGNNAIHYQDRSLANRQR